MENDNNVTNVIDTYISLPTVINPSTSADESNIINMSDVVLIDNNNQEILN